MSFERIDRWGGDYDRVGGTIKRTVTNENGAVNVNRVKVTPRGNTGKLMLGFSLNNYPNILISIEAYKALRSPERVALTFDGASGEITLHPLAQGSVEGFPVISKQLGSPGINCRKFLKRIGFVDRSGDRLQVTATLKHNVVSANLPRKYFPEHATTIEGDYELDSPADVIDGGVVQHVAKRDTQPLIMTQDDEEYLDQLMKNMQVALGQANASLDQGNSQHDEYAEETEQWEDVTDEQDDDDKWEALVTRNPTRSEYLKSQTEIMGNTVSVSDNSSGPSLRIGVNIFEKIGTPAYVQTLFKRKSRRVALVPCDPTTHGANKVLQTKPKGSPYVGYIIQDVQWLHALGLQRKPKGKAHRTNAEINAQGWIEFTLPDMG